ncbi:calcium uniporter regulatory subunit MCUb, mitochondrial-like [Stigmatopora nigra]
MMSSTRLVGKVARRLLGSLGARRPAFQAPRPAIFLHKVPLPLLGIGQAVFCSTSSPPAELSLKYKHGRLALEVPLTCRSETCLFFLRPMLMTVGDLIGELQKEDPGASTAAVLSKDGERVASNTLLEALLIDKHFKLVINNTVYNVYAPDEVSKSSEHALQMDDMKHVVQLLHTALNLPEHQFKQERQLLEKLDRLKQELSPLEKVKAQLSIKADAQTSRAIWGGLALLSVQGGALGWLTWWVYSWDVMEPVTYFVTYVTSMGAFAFYVLTKKEYFYPNAKDRQFLNYFHKAASKKKFNVEKYNELRDELAEVEDDLKRLRYPMQLQLPIEQIQPKQ